MHLDMGDRMAMKAHACFGLEVRFPVALPTANSAIQLWEALSYHIMREPMDLLAHTRRVRLCRHPSLRERLPGALHDLDYVTQGRATSLRQRLLNETKAVLGEHMRSHFQEALSPSEDAPKLAAERFPGSVLPTIAQARDNAFPGTDS